MAAEHLRPSHQQFDHDGWKKAMQILKSQDIQLEKEYFFDGTFMHNNLSDLDHVHNVIVTTFTNFEKFDYNITKKLEKHNHNNKKDLNIY